MHRHTIAVLLENTIGALIRVVNLFSARGFNLESVTVGETDDPTISRMTIVTTGNDRIIGQVLRQLDRLIDTLHVEDLTGSSFVERELCLLKVRYTNETRAAIMGHGRDLPRQGGGHHARHDDLRADRSDFENRGLHQADEAARHSGGGP
ncbi:acetolactate synthase, small subunit [Rhodothermus marinus DSM 4252]|uniref:Acetolactate synthase small subunit n=1 Tax=Rhodothermus marinus (strain ATCC 43812 / DSM 4252 / R-10) TaxID=518766 RepID=D0MG79_RHOM4|nr:acetolactate synthase, small subunit [Rhodothermus marinus DSM 4252]